MAPASTAGDGIRHAKTANRCECVMPMGQFNFVLQTRPFGRISAGNVHRWFRRGRVQSAPAFSAACQGRERVFGVRRHNVEGMFPVVDDLLPWSLR